MRIWLDDNRPMPADFDLHVRTEAEAIEALLRYEEMVTEISLDCDLGHNGGRGYNVALWITAQWNDGGLAGLRVLTHSANPVERKAVTMCIARAHERRQSER